MATFDEKAKDFLAQQNIAVVGVSHTTQDSANLIYKTLRDKGYKVFAVNPNAETVEGDTCYPTLQSLPMLVDGAVIVTRPEVTEKIAQDCVDLHVPRVWIHRNAFFGQGSLSNAAVTTLEQHGVEVIAGGCPMMFLEFAHKCMKFVLKVTGQLPA